MYSQFDVDLYTVACRAVNVSTDPQEMADWGTIADSLRPTNATIPNR